MLQTSTHYYTCFHAAVCRALRVGILPCGNNPIRSLLIVCLSCFSFISCDIDDERDLCCDRIVMEYRYLQDGEEAFKENIHSLRHFLFDAQGRFLQEVPPGNNLQLQILDPLETGKYTMVTIGNATDATTLTAPKKGSLCKDFILQVSEANSGNTDPLYYGICDFTLIKESAKREQRFVTQMSNVHCRLKVTVKWQNLPPVLTKDPVYRMVLENCAEDYETDGEKGYSLGEKHFPYSPHWNRTHRLDRSLEGLQLKGDFISLRYTDGNLPVLHVLYRDAGGKEYIPLTPELDLKKAFIAWGYHPSSVERQEYRIIVTIYLDGHVGIRVEAEAGVADWVDGGVFG